MHTDAWMDSVLGGYVNVIGDKAIPATSSSGTTNRKNSLRTCAQCGSLVSHASPIALSCGHILCDKCYCSSSVDEGYCPLNCMKSGSSNSLEHDVIGDGYVEFNAHVQLKGNVKVLTGGGALRRESLDDFISYSYHTMKIEKTDIKQLNSLPKYSTNARPVNKKKQASLEYGN